MTELVRKPASANNSGELDNTQDPQAVSGNKEYTGNVTHQGSVTMEQPMQGQLQSPAYNLLINGDMGIWQRTGGASTQLLSTVNYFGADRFFMEKAGGSASVFTERSTTVPNETFKYSMLFTGGESLDTLSFGQRIEAGNIRHLIGKTVTLSFWLKSDPVKSFNIKVLTPVSVTEDSWIQDNPGTDTEEELSVQTPSGTGWQQFSYTFVVPSTAQYGLSVMLEWSAKIDLNDLLYTTGWTLTEGNQALDFQRAGRNIQDELAMCQRYYQTYSFDQSAVIANGFVWSTSDATVMFSLATSMRTLQPLFSPGDTNNNKLWQANSTFDLGMAITNNHITAQQNAPGATTVQLKITRFGSLSPGPCSLVHDGTGLPIIMTFDSEL